MIPPSISSHQAAGGMVHTVMERVTIDQVRQEQAQIELECFTPVELAQLAQRRIQSLAGSLVVKRALRTLHDLLTPPASLPATERMFILNRAIHTPPVILEGWQVTGGRVWVSLAHTRSHAYGLAVWQEDSKE